MVWRSLCSYGSGHQTLESVTNIGAKWCEALLTFRVEKRPSRVGRARKGFGEVGLQLVFVACTEYG